MTITHTLTRSVLTFALLSLGATLFGVSARAATAATAPIAIRNQGGGEDWKGAPDPSQIQIGVMAGLGVIDSSGGFALIPSIAKKIIDHGFIPDMNDAVWIEAEAGPVFFKGATAFFYSAHLRWDFIKDDTWTLYGIGGFGGSGTSASLGSHFEFFPRFGAGAIWDPGITLRFRGEISHELIALGVVFPF